MRFRLVRSPLVEWRVFSEAFQDRFIPWSVQKESQMRFESLTQGSMTIVEYEAQFYKLSLHAISFIPTEEERVCELVRARYSFLYQVLCIWLAHEVAFIQSIVSIAKETELMV